MRRNPSALPSARIAFAILLSLLVHAAPVLAQETGTVTGTVRRATDAEALSSVSVTVQATGQSTVTGADGRYTLRRVPVGSQTIVFRWLGFRPAEVPVTVEPDKTVTADAAMEAVTVSLDERIPDEAFALHVSDDTRRIY